jgi:hypothetical protein
MQSTDYNLFLKLCIDIIKGSIPNLFHKCPYVGLNEFYNITLDINVGKSFAIFPEGQYKYDISLAETPDVDPPTIVLTVFTEVSSPLKRSFG